VPGAALPAEEIAPPAPSTPEPHDGGYGLMDELDSAIAAAAPGARSSATLSAPGGEEGRRPCPACGEMIIAGAAKCRFCGEIFDARLRATAAEKKSKYESDAFRHEKRGIEKGVLGGIVMMAVAVVWFVGGWICGFIFFYPPILFIIGLFALIKGLATGILAGSKRKSGYY